ncbi:hypothetical protein [Allocoleopsis sp.]|uniref:hypothetical protein n=1 Tax=Allocoleopsis sp. TaxID=3088169 RepID=UPI002FD00664
MIQRHTPSFLKRKRIIPTVSKIPANQPIKHNYNFRIGDRGCRPTIVAVAAVESHSLGTVFSRCALNNSIKMTRGDMAYALSKYLERQEDTAPIPWK